MFSLIITIVSIALVVALVAATLFHTGGTLTQGRVHAEAAALVAQAQQVAMAVQVRAAIEGVDAPKNQSTPAETLSPDYMRSVPAGWFINCGETVCQVGKALPPEALETCLTVNDRAGLGKTVSVTVFDLLNSSFNCTERRDGDSNLTGYQFDFLLRR